jgi:hypothetical protein
MAFEALKSRFQKQEKVPAQALSEARQQLHHAIFTLQALSAAYAPFQEDWAHISFHWNQEKGAFFSAKIPGKTDSAVFGLTLENPTVVQLDASEKEIRRSLSLEGVDLSGLQEWLREGASGLGLETQTLDFTLSKEMMPHDLSQGEAFRWKGLSEALSELKRAYFNGFLFLEAIHRENAQTMPVRCWPHHFDLAVLFEFEFPGDKVPKRTLGIGISPGDSFYETPYYYVTPWPFPLDLTLPPLPSGGKWRLEEWQGAVLTHEALVRFENREEQFKALSDFLLTTRQMGFHFLKVSPK